MANLDVNASARELKHCVKQSRLAAQLVPLLERLILIFGTILVVANLRQRINLIYAADGGFVFLDVISRQMMMSISFPPALSCFLILLSLLVLTAVSASGDFFVAAAVHVPVSARRQKTMVVSCADLGACCAAELCGIDFSYCSGFLQATSV